jgi:hypothetical protein
MSARRSLGQLAWLLPTLALGVACGGSSSNDPRDPLGSGGVTSTGGGSSTTGGSTLGKGGGTNGVSGNVGTGGSPGTGGAVGTGGSSPDEFVRACTEAKLGSPLLRLLNRAELDRTLVDVFPQIKGQWTNALPADTGSALGFDNDAGATVGNQRASALLDTALSVATALTGPTLNTTLPCAASSADRACAEQFLTQYGRRLFRRALSAAERTRYLTFFDSAKTKSDFKTALKWLTVGLIQSPHAVYRREIGTVQGDGSRLLSAHEIATELAYTYAGSTPSEDLLNKADSGALGDPVALAKSLLAADPSKQGLQHFFEGYLGYTRVVSTQKPKVPNFANVSNAMLQETRAFINDVLFQKGGSLKDLLTSPTTNPSSALASYYGFPNPSADFATVTRPSGRGVGILAQGSFLATRANSDASSPTQRGVFALSRVLCRTPPPVPDMVPPLKEVPAGVAKTTRQRYEELHAGENPCANCHKIFDPLGFGFEHFNEGGVYREMENGLPIDSASSVPGPNGGTLFAFANQEELAAGLAKEPSVAQCFLGFLATYTFGTSEPCLGTSNLTQLQSGSLGVAEAFTALAAEPHFTRRAKP